MKKTLTIIIALIMCLLLVFTLVACSGITTQHNCIDANSNHKCDGCSKILSTCVDNDNNNKCDICNKVINPETGDGNEPGEETHDCVDANNNHKCDICNDTLTTCIDSNNNHYCDICGETISNCKDDNKDHSCDICGEISQCTDSDNNHKCDICNDMLTTCIDSNNNHKCDICDDTLTTCIDSNNNHKCDICDSTLTSCKDETGDDLCDICGEEYYADGYVLVYELKGDGTYEVTGYKGTPVNVIIPSTYEDKAVTSICDHVFYCCYSLTSVTIPNSVTSIGDGAFQACDSLTSVTIGNSVESIGYIAFLGCYKLVEVYNLSSLNITAGSEDDDYVGYYAKDIYTSLDTPSKLSTDSNGYIIYTDGEEKILIGYVGNETALTLPSDITSINNYAFYGSFLTSITIGNSVDSIGDGAFYNCYKLVEVYNLSSLNITAGSEDNGCVGYYAKNVYTATSGSSKLSTDNNGYIIYTDGEDKILVDYVGNETKLTLPGDITAINDCAFYGCSSLTSITIGNSVESIGYGAFYGCEKLTSVTIGNSVESIGDGAFAYCDSLTSVTIPNSVKSIGSYAFYDCDSLTSVTIPDSVTSIGNYAFEDCYTLTYNVKDNVKYLGNETNLYLVAMGMVNKSATSLSIADTCKVISDYAFYYCTSLTNVTIPNSVTSIGECAFHYCISLTSVNYLGTIESWCGIAFDDYFANPLYFAEKLYLNGELLTDIVILNTITEIKDYAFLCCTSLTSIEIPSSVTNIGYGAFAGCTSLTSIVIPSSVTSIGSQAFLGCTSLASIEFEDTTDWYRTDDYDNWINKTGGTLVDVSTPTDNDELFVDIYYYDYYYKE